jgi:hypothetical protein
MTYLFISLKIQEKTECEYFEFEWIMKDHLALLGLCLLEKKNVLSGAKFGQDK